MANPRQVILVWAVLTLVLGTIGLFAKQVLHAEDLVIRGTPSAPRRSSATRPPSASPRRSRSCSKARRRGSTRAGPRSCASSTASTGVSVASPWSAGAPTLLREWPRPRAADRELNKDVIDAGRDELPKIQDKLDALLPPGVEEQRRRPVALLDRARQPRLRRCAEGRAPRVPVPAADPAADLPRADRRRDPADPGRRGDRRDDRLRDAARACSSRSTSSRRPADRSSDSRWGWTIRCCSSPASEMS